ncbi:MAG TPA: hypothetical protein VE524_02120 [Nitrososphaeraceae archaeon]|nr:hypothetical protein [Nitrososphaeraceae archaeon]
MTAILGIVGMLSAALVVVPIQESKCTGYRFQFRKDQVNKCSGLIVIMMAE